jgi:hypothetical protein
MSYCEHCEGQRFDRARVLRALRQVRKELQSGACENDLALVALETALRVVKALDVPHLEWSDDVDEVVH